MDGSQANCERARKFARRLHGRLGLPVEMVDERLTSFEAKQLSRGAATGAITNASPSTAGSRAGAANWLGGLDEPAAR